MDRICIYMAYYRYFPFYVCTDATPDAPDAVDADAVDGGTRETRARASGRAFARARAAASTERARETARGGGNDERDDACRSCSSARERSARRRRARARGVRDVCAEGCGRTSAGATDGTSRGRRRARG